MLANLLRRAIANCQLRLNVASPFASEEEWKASGHPINDRWDGNSTGNDEWIVSESMSADDGEFKEQPQVEIYVADNDLQFLAGNTTIA